MKKHIKTNIHLIKLEYNENVINIKIHVMIFVLLLSMLGAAQAFTQGSRCPDLFAVDEKNKTAIAYGQFTTDNGTSSSCPTTTNSNFEKKFNIDFKQNSELKKYTMADIISKKMDLWVTHCVPVSGSKAALFQSVGQTACNTQRYPKKHLKIQNKCPDYFAVDTAHNTATAIPVFVKKNTAGVIVGCDYDQAKKDFERLKKEALYLQPYSMESLVQKIQAEPLTTTVTGCMSNAGPSSALASTPAVTTPVFQDNKNTVACNIQEYPQTITFPTRDSFGQAVLDVKSGVQGIARAALKTADKVWDTFKTEVSKKNQKNRK